MGSGPRDSVRSTADAELEPIEPDLWNLTRAAVWAAGVAADQELARGGWRPRIALPTVSAFDSGWPNLSRSRLFPGDDAPTDFSGLFGPSRGPLKPIAYSDVPELRALIAYVRARTDLRARVAIKTATGNDDMERDLVEFEVADLALSLLDRARATGVTMDDGLLPLYLERERAWLLDRLPVEYVVPLVLTAMEIADVFVLDAATRIEPLDAATQAARAPNDFSISSVPSTVIGAATHALVLSGHHLPNPGPGPRLFGPDNEPPLDEADLACEALRIAAHVDVGYAQVLRRPLGWADRWEHDLPPLTMVTTVRRYPDSFDDYGWLRPPNPISADVFQQLPGLLASLRGAASHVRLAARRLSLAALRSADDDRTIDACIGLEALLGDGRDELSHRLALRAATVLASRASGPADAHAVYDLVKKVYSHRSAVVHGTPGERSRRIALGDNTYEAGTIAVMLLREVLTDALTHPGGWTPKELDATLLGALARPNRLDTEAGSGPKP